MLADPLSPLHSSTVEAGLLRHCIVAKGSVVLGLDEGSRVTLNEGDVVVQQSTMHNWCNETDQWARLYGMMVPA